MLSRWVGDEVRGLAGRLVGWCVRAGYREGLCVHDWDRGMR